MGLTAEGHALIPKLNINPVTPNLAVEDTLSGLRWSILKELSGGQMTYLRWSLIVLILVKCVQGGGAGQACFGPQTPGCPPPHMVPIPWIWSRCGSTELLELCRKAKG